MGAWARGGFGGGGRSSFGGGGRSSWGGGSRSYSAPAPAPRSSGWGGSRSSGASGWGSSTPTRSSSTPRAGWGSSSTTQPRLSTADRNLYQRAKTNGTSFSNRTDAVSNFKSRYAGQYPTSFAREPSSRPSYIPQTTMVGGRNVTIIYNSGYGGYGYMNPLTNAWIMYDLWSDHVMMDRMMYNQGYYYGASPMGYGPPVVYHASSIVGSIIGGVVLLIVLIVFIVVIALIVAASRRRRMELYDEPEGERIPAPAEVFHHEQAAYVPDEHATGYWHALTVDSIITLSDKQAISDSIEEGRGAVPRDYTVQEVWTLQEQHDQATWKLCHIADEKQALWFLAKLVGNDLDLRIYFDLPTAQYQPGNRRDLVTRGDLWLFQQPANPDHFTYDELHFTTEITGPAADGQQPPVFRMKGQGELSGLLTIDGGTARQEFATIVEYAADDGADNPELLLLEVGGLDLHSGEPCPDGGLITLLQGTPLGENEVEVLRKSPAR